MRAQRGNGPRPRGKYIYGLGQEHSPSMAAPAGDVTPEVFWCETSQICSMVGRSRDEDIDWIILTAQIGLVGRSMESAGRARATHPPRILRICTQLPHCPGPASCRVVLARVVWRVALLGSYACGRVLNGKKTMAVAERTVPGKGRGGAL